MLPNEGGSPAQERKKENKPFVFSVLELSFGLFGERKKKPLAITNEILGY